MGRSSRAGHMTMETVFGQTLALRLRNGDEHHALESDTSGLNVTGNLYLYLSSQVNNFLKCFNTKYVLKYCSGVDSKMTVFDG